MLLKSEEQKCLKAEHGAIRHGRRDRARKETWGVIRPGRHRQPRVRTLGGVCREIIVNLVGLS